MYTLLVLDFSIPVNGSSVSINSRLISCTGFRGQRTVELFDVLVEQSSF